MKHLETYSHRFGREAIKKISMYQEVTDMLNIPSIDIDKGSASKIKEAFFERLSKDGWALKPKIHPTLNISINAIKGRAGLTVQTGNMARGFYDLLKFQGLSADNRIDSAILILPSSEAANKLGHNVANFSRITGEINYYNHVITLPLLILSFD